MACSAHSCPSGNQPTVWTSPLTSATWASNAITADSKPARSKGLVSIAARRWEDRRSGGGSDSPPDEQMRTGRTISIDRAPGDPAAVGHRRAPITSYPGSRGPVAAGQRFAVRLNPAAVDVLCGLRAHHRTNSAVSPRRFWVEPPPTERTSRPRQVRARYRSGPCQRWSDARTHMLTRSLHLSTPTSAIAAEASANSVWPSWPIDGASMARTARMQQVASTG